MSNQYGSLLDTFTALDVYNLPMPVVPPADLVLNQGAIANSYLSLRNSASSKVVGFSPDDNPYIRSIGIGSNLADGLVDGSASHIGGASPSWIIALNPIRMGSPIPGSILSVIGTALVGNGTLFTNYCSVGMFLSWHDTNSILRIGFISSIIDDTNIILATPVATTGMYTGSSVGAALIPHKIGFAGAGITIPVPIMNTPFSFNDFLVPPGSINIPKGKIKTTAGSVAVTGVDTNFTKDFSPSIAIGQSPIIGWIDQYGLRRTGTVSGVADDFNLTLTANVPALGGTGLEYKDFIDLDESLRIMVSFPAAFSAYTISIDPAYGAENRRLSLHVMAEIEHTFPLSKTILQ
jgi:hypothetical protein